LLARVVRVKDVFDVIGTGYLNLHHCVLSGSSEMDHVRRDLQFLPSADFHQPCGIPHVAPANKERPRQHGYRLPAFVPVRPDGVARRITDMKDVRIPVNEYEGDARPKALGPK
jgi:hypothetical protein